MIPDDILIKLLNQLLDVGDNTMQLTVQCTTCRYIIIVNKINQYTTNIMTNEFPLSGTITEDIIKLMNKEILKCNNGSAGIESMNLSFNKSPR